MITPNDTDLYLKEFSSDRDRWADVRFRILQNTFDLGVTNSEREFNLFLNLVSISAVFLSIVGPIVKDVGTHPNLLSLVLLSFSLSFFFGLVGLLLTIKIDKKWIRENGDFQDSMIKGYQDKVRSILSKLNDYKKTPSEKLGAEIDADVEAYFSEGAIAGKLSKNQENKRNAEIISKIVFCIKPAFLTLFCSSIALILLWIYLNIQTLPVDY